MESWKEDVAGQHQHYHRITTTTTTTTILITFFVLLQSSLVSAEYEVSSSLTGGLSDIRKGRFRCPSCNTSRDCGVRASQLLHQKDTDWRIWRADNGYTSPTPFAGMKLCIRKWMVGCNGPQGPNLCNSYTEVCMQSKSRPESGRNLPYEVCSSHSFMSPASFTLVITIPIFLCIVSALSIVATLHHSFVNGYCQCPPSIEKIPVMLCSAVLMVFSFLTFFSPHFTCGVVGMFIAILAIISQTVAATMVGGAGVGGFDGDKDMTERAQRWLFAAGGSTVLLVHLAWGGGYPVTSTLQELGKECSEFYNFFVIDQRLVPGGADPYWGYCEVSYLEDTLWNVTAVLWIGLALGLLHFHSLGTLFAHRFTHRETEDPPSFGAKGPGAFLMSSKSKVHLDFTHVTGRHARRDHFHSVERYGVFCTIFFRSM